MPVSEPSSGVPHWDGDFLHLSDGSYLALHSEQIRGEPRSYWLMRHGMPKHPQPVRIDGSWYPHTGRGHVTKAEARKVGLQYARVMNPRNAS